MKWKVKLGKFAGIDVFIHFTFVLLIGWVGFLFWTRGNGLVSMIEGIIFILLLFTCVVLHEFGHALAAKKYGIKTRDIILLPIGGVARLERMPENPRQELWVALAGPAVNVVIASILFLWLQISQTFEPFQNLTLTTGSFAERLLSANVFLALFIVWITAVPHSTLPLSVRAWLFYLGFLVFSPIPFCCLSPFSFIWELLKKRAWFA
jgi:Zn-dependent protease